MSAAATLDATPVDVLHVLWRGTGGGAERHVLDLTLGMSRAGVRCCVLYLSEDGGAGDRLREAGALHRSLGLRGGRDPLGPRAVARAVGALDPALLHDHVSVPWLRALLPAKRGRTIVATEHGHLLRAPFQRSGPRLWIERAGARRTSLYIAPSAAIARAVASLHRFPPERIRVIPHGVEANPFAAHHEHERARVRREVRQELGIAGDATLLLFAGRLDETKGTLDLWEGFARASTSGAPLFLAIAGTGPLEARLRADAPRSVAGERVRLLGFRDDLPRFMAACDLFVLPSRQEALGIVLLEAMAAGVAVVATRAGGIPEIVEDGRTGLLVAPGDPAALAEAIVKLAGDPDRRAEMGAAGYALWARRYTLARCVEETLEAYRWARAL